MKAQFTINQILKDEIKKQNQLKKYKKPLEPNKRTLDPGYEIIITSYNAN